MVSSLNMNCLSRNHCVSNNHELCVLTALEIKKWNHKITVAQKLRLILASPLQGSFSDVFFREYNLYHPGWLSCKCVLPVTGGKGRAT